MCTVASSDPAEHQKVGCDCTGLQVQLDCFTSSSSSSSRSSSSSSCSSRSSSSSSSGNLYFGYCPHPVTVHIRGPIKSYIQTYYTYYPTVTEGGQHQTYIQSHHTVNPLVLVQCGTLQHHTPNHAETSRTRPNLNPKSM